MSRRIAIVGSGQAGLQLGIELLAQNYAVTLVTDKTGDEVAAGQILATPALFRQGQEYERSLAIDYWDDPVFPNTEVALDIRDGGKELLAIEGSFAHPAKLVDLRLKHPRWLAEFAARGGNVVIKRVDVNDLDALAADHDLLVVATGRFNTSLFERDLERSIWSGPLRRLRVAILHAPELDHWIFSFVPGVGELCAAPALALGGRPRQTVLVWGIPGGEFDFADGKGGEDTARGIKAAFQRHKPDHYEAIADRPLIDANAWLAGAVAPVVRKPVGRLGEAVRTAGRIGTGGRVMRLVWLVALLLAPVSGHAADPSVLWNIVDGKCLPHEQLERNPSPCSSVNIAEGVDKGFAVLKDRDGVAQFLLIPTARISGIDDPAILAPGETNYWDRAWQARHFVEERLHTSLPRDEISLAINSSVGRTQDQLHIHVDCIRPDVHDAVAANFDKITKVWTPFPAALAGHSYRAIRIDQETLDGVNPFHVLADADPKALADMAMHTLVVVGAVFPDGISGFVLLDDHADLAAGDRGSGEELQDHTCAIARK
jgi:CDP-diacylglycerol pyrophosphatase